MTKDWYTRVVVTLIMVALALIALETAHSDRPIALSADGLPALLAAPRDVQPALQEWRDH